LLAERPLAPPAARTPALDFGLAMARELERPVDFALILEPDFLEPVLARPELSFPPVLRPPRADFVLPRERPLVFCLRFIAFAPYEGSGTIPELLRWPKQEPYRFPIKIYLSIDSARIATRG